MLMVLTTKTIQQLTSARSATIVAPASRKNPDRVRFDDHE